MKINYLKFLCCVAAATTASNLFAQERPSDSSTSMPPELIGQWQVAGVTTDIQATHAGVYSRNDRRLVGRFFDFHSTDASTDVPEHEACHLTHWLKNTESLPALIAASMAGRAVGDPQPNAADFELASVGNKAVSSFQLDCQEGRWAGSLGRDSGPQGAWIVPLGNEKLLIRWYGETILQLHRVKAQSLPEASFDCKRAEQPSEKEICSSMGLASLDKSIATTYAAKVSALKSAANQSRLQELKAAQNQWLTKHRNACGSDEPCLYESMETRLAELVEADPE